MKCPGTPILFLWSHLGWVVGLSSRQVNYAQLNAYFYLNFVPDQERKRSSWMGKS